MSHWAETGAQAGPVQLKKKDEEKPTARRMVRDVRFDEESEVVQNGEGRIISVSVVGGMSRITIGMGRKQGVRPGMEGYIKRGSGMLADFQIDSTSDRTSHAMVDVTPEMIQQSLQVVVNPSQMPRSSGPETNMKARVVGVSIVGGRTRIVLSRGRSHGVRGGMDGYLLGSGGKPFERFTIDEAYSTHSNAFVETTIDGLKGHHEAILNPS